MNHIFARVGVMVAVIALVAEGLAACTPLVGRSSSQTDAVIAIDWQQIVGAGPRYYGVENSWVDEDSELLLERYRLLQPNLLRVQVTQEYFEPINDNADPNLSEIDFDVTFTLDAELGKHITYREMFSALGSEFPDMHFHINMWLAARWNASNPAGYLGLGGAFPPIDYAEHREFVREFVRWMVTTCGIAPSRISFSFINEPNLTPFFVGTQADLVRMAAETRAALDEVSPEIQMMGLDEVHGVSRTEAFYARQPESCCDAWIFHAYERGARPLWDALRTRVERLSPLGPVWVTEFADTTYGSPDAQMDFSSRDAALGFAEVTGRLWASGADGIVHFRFSDSYVDQLGGVTGWVGHGLFADWRGTRSDGEPYAIYPSFWVFANLYGQLGGGQLVDVTAPSDLVVVGARRNDIHPRRLALWVTNPTQTNYVTTIKIASFPTPVASVSILDNLTGATIQTMEARGAPLVVEVDMPERSSYTIVIEQPASSMRYLPLIVRATSGRRTSSLSIQSMR